LQRPGSGGDGLDRCVGRRWALATTDRQLKDVIAAATTEELGASDDDLRPRVVAASLTAAFIVLSEHSGPSPKPKITEQVATQNDPVITFLRGGLEALTRAVPHACAEAPRLDSSAGETNDAAGRRPQTTSTPETFARISASTLHDLTEQRLSGRGSSRERADERNRAAAGSLSMKRLNPELGASLEAIESVYRSRYRDFECLAQPIDGGPVGAKDVVDDAFVVVVRKHHSFRKEGCLEGEGVRRVRQVAGSHQSRSTSGSSSASSAARTPSCHSCSPARARSNKSACINYSPSGNSIIATPVGPNGRGRRGSRTKESGGSSRQSPHTQRRAVSPRNCNTQDQNPGRPQRDMA